MIKFKDFKFKRTATDQPNALVDNAADAPQATVAATASISEGSVPKDWRLRDVEKHLKKRGFSEDRHSGGHKIFTHPQKGTISVPAHPTAYISPGVIRKVFDISEGKVAHMKMKYLKKDSEGQYTPIHHEFEPVHENGDDQMLVPPNKGKKTFMNKATNVSPPNTGKFAIGTVIDGDGRIGVSS